MSNGQSWDIVWGIAGKPSAVAFHGSGSICEPSICRGDACWTGMSGRKYWFEVGMSDVGYESKFPSPYVGTVSSGWTDKSIAVQFSDIEPDMYGALEYPKFPADVKCQLIGRDLRPLNAEEIKAAARVDW